MLVNVNVSKSSQRIQPQKLFKLPQDVKSKKTKGKVLSKEEVIALTEKWDKTLKEGKIRKL